MRLGKLLKQHRAFAGYGIRQFAAELGVSAATLSRIERGENMDGKTLAKILSWLLTENTTSK